MNLLLTPPLPLSLPRPRNNRIDYDEETEDEDEDELQPLHVLLRKLTLIWPKMFAGAFELQLPRQRFLSAGQGVKYATAAGKLQVIGLRQPALSF